MHNFGKIPQNVYQKRNSNNKTVNYNFFFCQVDFPKIGLLIKLIFDKYLIVLKENFPFEIYTYLFSAMHKNNIFNC